MEGFILPKKYISGVMVALIAILSLFGSGDTSFAASPVGGPSLSKYWFVEDGELPNEIKQANSPVTDAEMWKVIDDFFTPRLTRTDRDYYHIFMRTTRYDDKGDKADAYDIHQFVNVSSESKTSPIVESSVLRFKNSLGQPFPFEVLQVNKIGNSFSTELKWDPRTVDQGLSVQTQGSIYTITVFEKMNPNTIYDPNKPPAYGMPGMTDPMEAGSGGTSPNPGNPSNPNSAPTRPTPPESNWDIIGWLKYLGEWFVYVWDTFVWLVGQLGSKIGELISSSDGLINLLKNFFSWMPAEITTLMGVGIIVSIILMIFKR